jgi:hypothetical protein
MEEEFLIAQKKRWAKIHRLVAHGFIPHILKQPQPIGESAVSSEPSFTRV